MEFNTFNQTVFHRVYYLNTRLLTITKKYTISLGSTYISQLPLELNTRNLSKPSNTKIVCSNWSSICQLKIILRCNLMPKFSCIFFNNQKVHLSYLSYTSTFNMSCNQKISFTYNIASFSTKYVCLIDKKNEQT